MKYSLLKIFGLTPLIMAFIFAPFELEAKEPMTKQYFISVQATGLHAAVKINDLPVIILNEGSELVTEKPVTTWLKNGDNALSAALIPLPGQDEIAGKLTAKLFLHDETKEAPTPQEVLAEIVYPILDTGSEVQTRANISQSFEFNVAITKLWQEADPIHELTEQDKSDIQSLVLQLQNALINDGNEAVKLQEYKVREDAIAEGKDADQVIKATKTTYNWLAQQPNVTAVTVEPADLRYTIGGNNNVVFVSKANLENALQLENDDLFFEIPIYVGKISGTWKLVR